MSNQGNAAAAAGAGVSPTIEAGAKNPHESAWLYCWAVYRRYAPYPKSTDDNHRMILTLIGWHERSDPVFQCLEETLLELFQRNGAAERMGQPFPPEDAREAFSMAYRIFARYGGAPITAAEWTAFFTDCSEARRAHGPGLVLESLLHAVFAYWAELPRALARINRQKVEAWFRKYPGEADYYRNGEDKLD